MNAQESYEEYIVGYSDKDSIQRFIEENSLEVVCDLEQLNLVCIRSREFSQDASRDIADWYSGILFVEPNYPIMLEPFQNASLRVDGSSVTAGVYSDFINDPFWGDDPLTGLGQWNMRAIEADKAWDKISYGSEVVVSVIDTGIFYNHPDLASVYLAGGYDWVNGDDDPVDDNGHGSWVSGIISAERNNSYGVTGVTPALLVAEKVLNENGQGSIADLVSGIIHSVDLGVDVLSISLGTYSYSTSLELAINYANDNGCIVVASAGNDRVTRPRYPAALPNVLAVTATFGEPERVSWYSNYGQWVNLSAPGGQDYDGDHVPDPGEYWVLSASDSVDGFMYGTGTSASTPHVSGVAALVKGVNPLLNTEEVIQILKDSADDLGDPGWDAYYGDGRVNAYEAVKMGVPASVGGDSTTIKFTSNGQLNVGYFLFSAIISLVALKIILSLYTGNRFHLKRT